MSKPICINIKDERFECFRVSTADRLGAPEPLDSYVVPGVGWVTLGRATGAVVEIAPLSENGGRILEAIAAKIFKRLQSPAAYPGRFK